ncbi:restriction endonuclease subunit S [Bifidobacterium longum]|nr:restriction endonuclease subunit S [Bifidobacterium longum]KAB7159644.1 restriction endonuclease subunit S [Bifidobacterium longum]PKY76269.1 restriction endonuclease subunit S [Bifidobacterium longum]
MMTEQAKVPAIRFAGFTDPWEQRKLGEIVDVCSGRDYKHLSKGPIPVYGTGGYMTSVSEGLSYEEDAIGIGRKGTIDHPYRLNAPFWTVDTLFYSLPNQGIDLDFTLCVFLNVDWKSKDESTGLPSLSKQAINETKIWVPSGAEQRAIGAFFSRLDDLITLHQRKYDKLVIFKKSMLEKMFPKDGESVPEIRFAGFTDPWEQRKLGEIVSIGAGAPPSAFSAGNFLYVKVDDLNESSHFQFDSAQRVDANTAVKPIRKGSIIFAKRGAAILGNKVRVLGKTAYIDTNMMALEPRGVDADFLWLFINQTGLYRIADTSTIPQINNKHIEPYPVDIPNMAEQQAIGTFFSRLDDLITLHQRKLELLQDIKKSLLDKMFV